MQGLALTIALIGSFASFHYMRYVYPKSLKPMINVIGELKSLGEIGIIGEYWNSYISACPDPYAISAIPNDASFNRDPKQIEEVFNKPKLFIIKDMWLKNFPDSLTQYGYTLRKKGDSLNIANCYLNEYEIVPKLQRFTSANLKTIQNQEFTDSLTGRKLIHADSGCLDCKWKHLVYGPGISLGKGKFKVGFYIKFDNVIAGKMIATIDVTANFGTKTVSSNTLRAEDVQNCLFR